MEIEVKIWRRGRGVLTWRFYYCDYRRKREAPKWYSSPGWYHPARKYTYRLTLDHDYPAKPLWLGRKRLGLGRGRNAVGWECMEGLYEPLTIRAPGVAATNTVAFKGTPRRSAYRIRATRREIVAYAVTA